MGLQFYLRLCAAAYWVLCAVLLSGCVSSQGTAEFESYRAATLKLSETSTLILDQHAVQERALFLKPESKQLALKFDPDLASYYTDTVDPPATRAFRNAFQAVIAYNDLLYGLSSGQTADALTAKIGTLNSSLANSIRSADFLSSSTLPQRVAISAGLQTAFFQVRPLLRAGLGLRSRQRFREYLIAFYPATRNLLVGLRQSTSNMFLILNAPELNRIRASATGQPSKEDLEHIVTYRRLLANWVILIDAAIDGLDAAKRSIDAPASPADVVGGLTTATEELNAASLAARRDLAALAAK
ncbi:hypothetical protein [Mesorhizobium sp. ORM16]|uniref:hypothetical protein n=1 Tax=Mesorhizobium sp. ORM16 TaxID=3376989 RepID=UPI0038575E93